MDAEMDGGGGGNEQSNIKLMCNVKFVHISSIVSKVLVFHKPRLSVVLYSTVFSC